MAKNSNYYRPLAITTIIFMVILVGTAFFLFSPVLECMHNFGGYVEDCDDAFSLFLAPFAIIFIIWSIIFIIAIFIVLSKQKTT